MREHNTDSKDAVTRLEEQFAFILELDKLKQVMRQSYLTDNTRRENDAEHSWHLAMMALVLHEYAADPQTDLLRVIAMVLVHDLVEIDAGDTFLYDERGNADKEAREQTAAARVFGLLPADQSAYLRGLWEEFEAAQTPEAQFARSLDRVEPLLLNYHTECRSWREHQVSLDMVLAHNTDTLTNGSPVLAEYMLGLIHDADAHGYFNKGDEHNSQLNRSIHQGYIQQLRSQVGHQPLIAIGATVIVTDEEGAVLFQRRSDFGTWGLPGGVMEPGETLEETARRELREETGLCAESLRLLAVCSGPDYFITYPNGDQLHGVVVLFHAIGVTGDLQMTDGESLDLTFFRLDNLPVMEPQVACLIPYLQQGQYAISQVMPVASVVYRPLLPSDQSWLAAQLQVDWGGTTIVTRGKIHQAEMLPGIIALAADEPVGVVLSHMDGTSCEIVLLQSLQEGIGIGTTLLKMVRHNAQAAGCKRLWLVTTNDNTPALSFYQKRGFQLVAIHRDALTAARKLKPTIPLYGIESIPIRDEIELEIRL